MRSLLLVAGLVVSSPGAFSLQAATSERSAQQLVAICASCHRLDNRPNGIPPIVGLGEAQIVDMMDGFRLSPQPNLVMHVVSSALSTREVATVATYLSDLGQEKAR